MKIKVIVSVSRNSSSRVVEIPDEELAGLKESARQKVVRKYAEKELWRMVYFSYQVIGDPPTKVETGIEIEAQRVAHATNHAHARHHHRMECRCDHCSRGGSGPCSETAPCRDCLGRAD